MTSIRFGFPFACCLALVAATGCSSSDEPSNTATDSGTSDSGGSDTGGGTDSGGGTDTGGGSETSTEAGPAPSCSDYCGKIATACTGTVNNQYIDSATCAAMCAKMTPGADGEMSGDTVGCRATHAGLAASAPDTHCRHAGAYGGGVCGTDRCADFCKLAMAQCGTVSGTPFTSEGDCKTKCAAIPFDDTKGEIDGSAVGKLNCVQYHLEAAYASSAAAMVHCAHLTTASGPCKAP